MRHGIVNESAALSEYISLLTTQPVKEKLVQPGLILSNLYPFVGTLLNPTVKIVCHLDASGVKTRCLSSKLDQGISDVLKDKKFSLEKKMTRFS